MSLSRVLPPNLGILSPESLVIELERWGQAVSTQLSAISEETLDGHYAADTAAPTTQDHAVGDFVRNSTPSEAGSVGSKYVVLGWVCTAAGTPGTFLQCRVLTGN